MMPNRLSQIWQDSQMQGKEPGKAESRVTISKNRFLWYKHYLAEKSHWGTFQQTDYESLFGKAILLKSCCPGNQPGQKGRGLVCLPSTTSLAVG